MRENFFNVTAISSLALKTKIVLLMGAVDIMV